MQEISVRTGVWYGERAVRLRFPRDWRLSLRGPQSPPALSDAQLEQTLEHPVGQASIRELCRGKSSPLVIVDDPNRPTPVDRILPFLLRQFRQAGIDPQRVRILIATGTHGAPRPETMEKKIGPEVASTCQVLIHDAYRNLSRLGVSSWGTPVEVNREVLQSDVVIGVGGIYPNHTAGYGGGSKLALGVLGFRTIRRLHYGHTAVGWSANTRGSSFRRDLDEISRMIHLNTMVSVQVNANREVVRVDCGDPLRYFDQAVAFYREAFAVPEPGPADVVVSNAFPNDLSLTFSRMKGMTPLYHCVPQSSRILIASCSEGLGDHGLFPLSGRSWASRQYQLLLRLGILGPRRAAKKVAGRLGREFRDRARGAAGRSTPENPIWLYRPAKGRAGLPYRISSIQVAASWEEILRAVTMEQKGRRGLRVVVYPCAPLQILRPVAECPVSLPLTDSVPQARFGNAGLVH